MHVEDADLQHRRLEAVRAWTAFVEHGDGASAWCDPRSATSWERSDAPITPDLTEAPLADEADTAAYLARLAAADRGRARRGGAAADRRGRRPRHRGHRRRDPDPVDLRRAGDAAQGRDRELRARRSLGRRERRHQRAGPRQPDRPTRRWCSAPSTTPRSCTTGCAGPRRCTTRSTGEQLGVIDLSTTWDRTHPIGLATARVMARLIETGDAALAPHPGLVAPVAPDDAGPDRCGCSAPPRRTSTGAGCC